MKKNKTVAFMLAASLMVGGTFLGTKAWFTDGSTADTDLVITTGNLDVEVEDIGWYLTEPETEGIIVDKEGITGNTIFKNLKPGDVLYKSITIKNIGTLDQILDVEGGDIKDESSPFDVSVDYTSADGKTLAPGDHTGFEITVKISEDWTGEEMNFDLSNYMNDIVIDAEQTPARK